MRAEHWECKLKRSELCEYEFYDSRDFLSVNFECEFIRAELFK